MRKASLAAHCCHGIAEPQTLLSEALWVVHTDTVVVGDVSKREYLSHIEVIKCHRDEGWYQQKNYKYQRRFYFTH